MSDDNSRLPLAGVVVLELGHTVMGPTAGMILADMGAKVIKVERAPKGDDTRRLAGFGAGFFPYLNRNKNSIAVNLKSDEGKKVLLRLIEKADVLIENFGPGAMDRLGLGYPDCRKINPRLIYCTLKGFMPGPYENRPALDEVVQMMGGLAYMTGPIGRPLRAGASVVDIMGGTFGAVGILTALYNRTRTGKGELVRATLFESVAFLVGQHMAIEAVTGNAPPPMPERGRAWSIYDLFETADKDLIFLGVTSDVHWQNMCRVFGFRDLAEDERLATNNQRVAERDWFLPEIQKRIRALPVKTVVQNALKAKIPFAPVAKPGDLFEDEHLNLSGGLAHTTLANGQKAKLPKIPLRLGDKSFDLRSDPPKVGRGTEALLQWAGMSREEIRELFERGVLAAES